MIKTNTPHAQAIGIIMDGNRRYAKARGLPVSAGHMAGYEKLKDVVSWAKECGVKMVYAYAFSTENWKRGQEEVSFLMNLLRRVIAGESETFKKEGARVRFIGRRDMLPEDIQEEMAKIERETASGSALTLVLAVSYGGRADIIAAAARAAEAHGAGEIATMSEDAFGAFFETAGLPDPDLVVRTGGEMRLSNFLPWQSVYSELFFTKTLWPDFSQEEFEAILADFSARTRRMGK